MHIDICFHVFRSLNCPVPRLVSGCWITDSRWRVLSFSWRLLVISLSSVLPPHSLPWRSLYPETGPTLVREAGHYALLKSSPSLQLVSHSVHLPYLSFHQWSSCHPVVPPLLLLFPFLFVAFLATSSDGWLFSESPRPAIPGLDHTRRSRPRCTLNTICTHFCRGAVCAAVTDCRGWRWQLKRNAGVNTASSDFWIPFFISWP